MRGDSQIGRNIKEPVHISLDEINFAKKPKLNDPGARVTKRGRKILKVQGVIFRSGNFEDAEGRGSFGASDCVNYVLIING